MGMEDDEVEKTVKGREKNHWNSRSPSVQH